MKDIIQLTQVKKGKSENPHLANNPFWLPGTPLQILAEAGTSGGWQPNEGIVAICDAGTGFLIQSKSCSLETIQTFFVFFSIMKTQETDDTHHCHGLEPNPRTG